jgi:hypothetical protein
MVSDGLLPAQAIETFDANKAARGITPRVRAMYIRELKRLRDFSESKGLLTVKRALTIDNLIALRATWTPIYKSSYSRATVQKHLNHFLRFCYNAGWIGLSTGDNPTDPESHSAARLSNSSPIHLLNLIDRFV